MNATVLLHALSLSTVCNDPTAPATQPLVREIRLAEDVTLKPFGRVFVDWGWFSGDSPTYSTDGTTLADGTEFRAARLGAEGRIHEHVAYKADFEFAGGEVELRNVYMALPDTAAGEVRGGHFKEPFSLEQNTSSRFTTFLERSLADAFSPAFNSGVAVFDANEAQTLTWGLGLFRTTDAFGTALGDAQYGYTARVTGTPWNEDDGADVLHLGAAVSYRTDEMVRYRSRPEAHLLNQPADTGTIATDSTMLVGLEAAWVQGPLSLQAEYESASVDAATGGTDGDFSGAYAFVSWFLTGEHRPYKASAAAFDRVKPKENYGEGPGAVELAARWSMIDLDDGPSTDTMDDVTVGVNWYLNPNSRVMLNWVHSQLDDGTLDDSADALMVRLQFDW